MAKDSLVLAIYCTMLSQTSAIVIGPPGVGKSSVIKSIADALPIVRKTKSGKEEKEIKGGRFEAVFGSLSDPTDINGIPIVRDDGFVSPAPPAWLRRIKLAYSEVGGTPESYRDGLCAIVIFDELTNCSSATQAALMRAGLDKVIGEESLGEGIGVVFAANPPDQSAVGNEIALPLKNRMVFFYVDEARAHKWFDSFVMDEGKLSLPNVDPRWREYVQDELALVHSFLKARPDLTIILPKTGSEQDSYPTPRSWAALARQCAVVNNSDMSESEKEEVLSLIASGTVGKAGFEYLTWRQNLDLPTPEQILADPENVTIPTQLDKLFAFGNSIAYHLSKQEKMKQKEYDAALTVVARIIDMKKTDIGAQVAARVIKIATKTKPALKTPQAIKALWPVLMASKGMIQGME